MRATRTTHVALFCLAAAVLILEIALTRVFSITLWSHYTFLVISTALLGFGAAGSYLSVRAHGTQAPEVQRFLFRSCVCFAVSTLLSVMLASRLGLDTTRILLDVPNTLKLGALYAIVATPFFFAGLAVCRILSIYASQINTIYFADLGGAAAGALLVTLLLHWIGAPATILVSCTLAIAAGMIFARPMYQRLGYGLVAVFGIGIVLVFAYDPWNIPAAPSKGIHRHGPVTDTFWSLHARIDVLESRKRPLNFGSGVAKEFFDRPVVYRPIFMDGAAPSRMIADGQDPWFLDRLLTAAPYALGLERPQVLIIGSGGGIDTLVAHHHGAAHVTAVEINPVTARLVREDFADYLGHLFSQPDVTLVAQEGRHFLTLDEKRYDLIRLTGVDTQAAGASGANSLDSAYIYTTEALRDLFAHLTDDGVVAISRPRGWESERLVSVIAQALDELGFDDVSDRVAVVSNGRWYDTLLRRRPYRREEIASLEKWADESHMSMVYDPFTPRPSTIEKLLSANRSERERTILASRLNLRPVTDDAPFFFESLTLGGALHDLMALQMSHRFHSGYRILLLALLQACLLSVVCILLPLARGTRGIGRTPGRAWALLYFALLGLGFILVELVFIQKYMIVLGGPANAMSVTLSSILVFSGLGAFTAQRIAVSSRWAPTVALLVLVLLLGASLTFLARGLPLLLGFGFAERIALSMATIAPVSFALGWPFPLGIRILADKAPELIPWAWASNACLTVIGSVLCVVLSMNWGFSATLAVAIAVYVGALVCLNRLSRVGACPPGGTAPWPPSPIPAKR